MLESVFVRTKSFLKKKHRLEIVLTASFHYTTDVYPYQPTYRASIYMHLLLFVTLCENLFESLLIYDQLWEFIFLSIYENKQAYDVTSSKTNLLSSKTNNDTLLISHIPILCFLSWILLISCLSTFLLNNVSLNSLKSVAIFTPFAVLDYLPSIFFMECIFDFNPTNSSIIFPSDSSFILPITFLLVSSKNFESFE